MTSKLNNKYYSQTLSCLMINTIHCVGLQEHPQSQSKLTPQRHKGITHGAHTVTFTTVNNPEVHNKATSRVHNR